VLFAPDERVKQAIRAEAVARRLPVSPLDAAWLNSPDQGPAPLACAREPHPEGTWHHDGKGTWFR
jgi:hypothetical protein